MQILYQVDLRGESHIPEIRAGLIDGFDGPDVQESAFVLAQTAWDARAEADAAIEELAPQWPTHRQPPVDRAILRLAWHEMSTGLAPVKVAINEAIELAKQFGSENSAAFINGVLDKLARPLLKSEGETVEAQPIAGEPGATDNGL